MPLSYPSLKYLLQDPSRTIYDQYLLMEGFTLDSLLGEVSGKLDTKQFAMPRKSTTQALVYLMHLIHAGLDVGHCYARLFFADFRKSCDLVDHNFIIGELRNLQVHPAIIRWIKSFLTGREQSVKLATASSFWKKVNGAVPFLTIYLGGGGQLPPRERIPPPPVKPFLPDIAIIAIDFMQTIR